MNRETMGTRFVDSIPQNSKIIEICRFGQWPRNKEGTGTVVYIDWHIIDYFDAF